MVALCERSRDGVAFAAHLHEYGDRACLVHDSGRLTYREVAHGVAEAAVRMGGARRVVLIEAANEPFPLIHYLACLSVGHVPLLVPAADRAADELRATYRPDTEVRRDSSGGWEVADLTAEPVGGLHPELALLLSTSGSTGSPKLVRLSRTNVSSNAAAIGEYLGLDPRDVAATTLPWSYSYGLSVVHSQLAAGGTVVLTDRSVADSCFWDVAAAEGVTVLAGVPYSFEMLAASGFEDRLPESLRAMTQAGGRMDPDLVRRFAALGQQRGFDFYPMYGQSEATARIAYLEPRLAGSHPDCIGTAIPGGHLELRQEPGLPDGFGELVYRGPNVMMGYALGRDDLAFGETVAELHTGDLAERTPEGLLRIVGRRSRFAKAFGLRVDLDRLEGALAKSGVSALCVESNGGVGVLVAGDPVAGSGDAAADIADLVARGSGLPAAAVTVVHVPRLPRRAHGKPDYAAASRACESSQGQRDKSAVCGSGSLQQEIALVLAGVLRRDGVGPQDSFVTLRGDSLSYVAAAAALEQRLGRLPAGWQRLTVAELADHAVQRQGLRSRLVQVEVSVLLRAAAIVAVVASHIGALDLRGGAHLLLGLAGFNYARFQLADHSRRERLLRSLAAVGRVAAICLLWLVPLVLLSSDYGPSVLLFNNLLGPDGDAPEWRYWFVEALLYVAAASALLLWVPAVDRWERRFPFGVPLAVMLAGAAIALLVAAPAGPASMYTPIVVVWLFAAGWALAKAQRLSQRLGVLVIAAAVSVAFFNRPDRVVLVIAGLTAVAFMATAAVPRPMARIVSAVAAASLAIYLTHYQVYPLFGEHHWLALLASIALGTAAWFVLLWAASLAGGLIRGAPQRVNTGAHRLRSALQPVPVVRAP